MKLDRAAVIAAVDKLRAFIRENAPGQCKMLSLGSECPCPLCDVDRLYAAALRQESGTVPKDSEHTERAQSGPQWTELRGRPSQGEAIIQAPHSQTGRRVEAPAVLRQESGSTLSERLRAAGMAEAPNFDQRVLMETGVAAHPKAEADGALSAQAIERTRSYLHHQCDSENYEPARAMIDAVCDAALAAAPSASSPASTESQASGADSKAPEGMVLVPDEVSPQWISDTARALPRELRECTLAEIMDAVLAAAPSSKEEG